MNAYKDWEEGLLTDAEYASIRYEEKIRYEEEGAEFWDDEFEDEDDEMHIYDGDDLIIRF